MPRLNSRGVKDANHALQNALVHHVAEVKIEDFYNIENLWVECAPRCGVVNVENVRSARRITP